MKIVEVIVEHAGNNLSAYIEGAPVITVGNDVKEIEKNMKEAVELVRHYIEDDDRLIAIQQDPDADGLTSTALMYMYLRLCMKSVVS